MCEVCGCSGGHLSGCPEGPGPKVIHTCKFCGDDIVEGEECYELDGEYWHEDCFGDAALALLTERFGARLVVAEEDDYD